MRMRGRVGGQILGLLVGLVVLGLTSDRSALASACHADAVLTAQAALSDECIQGKQLIISQVIDLIRAHQDGCRQDRDCILVETRIPCQDGCRMAVLRSRRQAFRRALNAYAESVCPTTSTECGIEGRCPEVSRATCMRSTCQPDIPGLR